MSEGIEVRGDVREMAKFVEEIFLTVLELPYYRFARGKQTVGL